MSIVVLSGAIRSGKTSGLMEWVNTRGDVSGILMPDKEGRRMFYDINGKQYFAAEVVDASSAVAVGRFLFSREGFHRANEILINAVTGSSRVIIIDEAGKLELSRNGFYPSLVKLVPVLKHDQNRILLVVIRKELIETVAERFFPGDFQIIRSVEELDL